MKTADLAVVLHHLTATWCGEADLPSRPLVQLFAARTRACAAMPNGWPERGFAPQDGTGLAPNRMASAGVCVWGGALWQRARVQLADARRPSSSRGQVAVVLSRASSTTRWSIRRPAAGGAVHLKNPWMPCGGGSGYGRSYSGSGHASRRCFATYSLLLTMIPFYLL